MVAWFAGMFTQGAAIYRDISIRLKIALILIVATLFAFLVAGCAVLIYETTTFKPRSLGTLEDQAKILSEVLVPSLQFQDNAAAEDYLATLKHWQQIHAAGVYDRDGDLFSTFLDSNQTGIAIPKILPALGTRFETKYLTYCAPIRIQGAEVVGYIWIQQSLLPLMGRLPQYGILFATLALSIGVVTGLVAMALKHSVLIPIFALSKTAQSVMAHQDFRLRVVESGNDEIGDLTKSFNLMLNKIEQRDHSLRQSEERFSKAFMEIPVPLVIARQSDTQIVEVNPSCLAMLGLSREETIGRIILDLGFITDEALRAFLTMMESQDQLLKKEAAIRTKQGSVRDALVSLEKIVINDEPCYLVTIDDITEQKMAEASLRQSQKMEAIGLLAGGIAHDFNNLLTAIIGYGSMAADLLEPGSRLTRPIQQILSAGEKAEGLTRQLLAYSRKQVLQQKVWDLNQIVGEMQQMLGRLINADIELAFIPKTARCLAMVDRGQVEQILLNLAVNARDAMTEGGRLTLETSIEMLDKTMDSQMEMTVKPGAFAVISVSDTGIGMTEEIRRKLFEPFFTTKEVGKGTGLGLSVVYGIVKQCGGSISVYSEPGIGTTFRIYFPIGEGEPVSETETTPKADMADYSGNEMVLLVEDEPLVRELTQATLENLGYQVVACSNGNEGLVAFQKGGNSIQIVISDMIMPIMGGRELAQIIRTTRPEMPVLFVSGYSDDGFRQKSGLRPGDPFLQKPFTSQQLAKAVRNLLDGNLPSNQSHAELGFNLSGRPQSDSNS